MVDWDISSVAFSSNLFAYNLQNIIFARVFSYFISVFYFRSCFISRIMNEKLNRHSSKFFTTPFDCRRPGLVTASPALPQDRPRSRNAANKRIVRVSLCSPVFLVTRARVTPRVTILYICVFAQETRGDRRKNNNFSCAKFSRSDGGDGGGECDKYGKRTPRGDPAVRRDRFRTVFRPRRHPPPPPPRPYRHVEFCPVVSEETKKLPLQVTTVTTGVIQFLRFVQFYTRVCVCVREC